MKWMITLTICVCLFLTVQSVFAQDASPTPNKKVIYRETSIDFEGLSLDGELKAPGEFYFQNRNQERFDSLSKRRLNFRREMLRDAVQSN